MDVLTGGNFLIKSRFSALAAFKIYNRRKKPRTQPGSALVESQPSEETFDAFCSPVVVRNALGDDILRRDASKRFNAIFDRLPAGQIEDANAKGITCFLNIVPVGDVVNAANIELEFFHVGYSG